MREIMLFIFAGCTVLLMESLCIKFLCWVLRPYKMSKITVMPLYGDCIDIEAKLRWQFFKMDTNPIEHGGILLLVDMGICEEACKIADILCRRRGNCRVCSTDELRKILGGYTVCKGVELVLY